MEIIMTLIVLIIVWCIAFMVGAKQQSKKIEKLKTKNYEPKKVRQGKAVSKVTQVTKETKPSGRKRKLD